MKNIEAYLYGMVLGTHSFLLMDDFLKPDVYSEIKEQYFLPGGETGTAATVLESLGVSVRIDFKAFTSGRYISFVIPPATNCFIV